MKVSLWCHLAVFVSTLITKERRIMEPCVSVPVRVLLGNDTMTFFLLIPFYLQAVQIHSANGVKLLEA
jgi:hypothetical protein